jgi:hypothetical protein
MQQLTSSLKCIYSNATSLVNKWDEFKALVFLHKADIALITETWFNESCPTNVEGYARYSLNRSEGRGGGVVIYVKDCFESFEVKIGDLTTSIEHVWCTIKVKSFKLLVGCLYRPPWSDRSTNVSINEAIDAAASLVSENAYDNILIAGDFNYPDINWASEGGSFKGKGRPSSIDFVDIINRNHLTQFVLEPTFGKKVLDLVFSDDPNCIFSVSNGAPIGVSDKNVLHSTLSWEMLLPHSTKVETPRNGRFNFRKASVDDMMRDFESIDWSQLETDADLDMDVKLFMESYWTVISRNVPFEYKRSTFGGNKPKWFNKDIKAALGCKFKLQAKFRASSARNKDKTRINFNRQSRLVKKLIREARRDYESGIASQAKLNPKLVYSYVNSQLKNKERIKTLVDSNGNSVNDLDSIAECLNLEFFKAFTKHDSLDQPNLGNIRERIGSLSMRIDAETVFSPDAVKIKLRELDVNKAPGADGIDPYVLNKCADILCYPLSLMFIKSFKLGIVPTAWKYANVTPIFKKGEKSNPGNYRPISLTSLLCRVKEKLLRDEMMRYLLMNRLVSKDQHGFVPAKSCVTNLIESMDIITEALNRGFFVIMILLDFSRAFDSVCHSLLLTKLEAYGFDSSLVKWISSFLTGRKQRVVMGSAYSEWIDVCSGVPQGSILGPLLFVLFINDMPQVASHFCKLYADDSKLIGVIRSNRDIERLQTDLDSLVVWANEWKMKFNISKCKSLEFHYNKPKVLDNDLSFTMAQDGVRTKLESTKWDKDLGVTLNSKLNFSDHIEQVALKGNKMLGMLKRTFKFWDIDSFRMLYGSLVRPHLEYAAAVWSPHLKKDIRKIERVQRRATKLVPELRDRPYEERLKAIGIQSLEQRRLRGDLIQFFKFSSGLNRVDWYHTMVPMASLSVDGPAGGIRGTRHRINKQLTKVAARANFLSNRIVDHWNELPAEIVNAKTSLKTNWTRSRPKNSNAEIMSTYSKTDLIDDLIFGIRLS